MYMLFINFSGVLANDIGECISKQKLESRILSCYYLRTIYFFLGKSGRMNWKTIINKIKQL